MTRRGNGDPSQWYNAVNWNAWSPQYPKGNKQKKPKDGEKEKKAEVVPGAYDSMPWDPSSQPSSSQQSSDEQARAFMDAFMKFTKEQDQQIPQALQPFFKQDTKEELKDQQKKLNQHRAILQKIENKRKAIRKDEEQWQHWLLEIKETIKKQRTRHEEQAAKLQEELEVLIKKEMELKTGAEENETSPIQVEDEEDVEEILDACLTRTPNKKKENEKTEQMMQGELNKKLQEMKKQLEEDYQQKFEAACSQANQSMQQQLQQHLAFQMMNMANQVDPGLPLPPGLPALGTEGANNAGNLPATVGPFCRRTQPKEREAQSPYARPAETMQDRVEKTHGLPTGGAG